MPEPLHDEPTLGGDHRNLFRIRRAQQFDESAACEAETAYRRLCVAATTPQQSGKVFVPKRASRSPEQRHRQEFDERHDVAREFLHLIVDGSQYRFDEGNQRNHRAKLHRMESRNRQPRVTVGIPARRPSRVAPS
jgi:hypothetical protein